MSRTAWPGVALMAGVIVLCNVAAHFLPFERAAVGSDDFAHWTTAQQYSASEIATLTPRQPDRPLTFAFLMAQERWMRGNPRKGLWLMVVTTSAVALLVFMLLHAVLRERTLACLGTLIFIALPHKLEVYHIPVYVAYEMANMLYIGSLTAFLYSIRHHSKRVWYLALGCYSVGLLFYETGFFLPGILMVYTWWFHRAFFKKACVFLIPAAIYLAFRFTRAFGLADATLIHDHRADLAMLPANLLDLAHHYVGRYLARNIAYGGYNFPRIELPWLLLIVVANVVLLALVVRWLRAARSIRLERAHLVLAGLLFAGCALPILLTSYGGVGGRQLVLPSIGLALALAVVIGRAPGPWSAWCVPVFAVALIVCQGNAWTHVVSCRITGAVYTTMQAQREVMQQAERIVIDTRSFADQIPFTWVQRDFNVLNTYYGAQTFEDWGLASMIRVVLGPHDKPIYVATERPQQVGQDAWRIGLIDQTGYRAAAMRHETVPREGTLLIGFQEVYGGAAQFHNGRKVTN